MDARSGEVLYAKNADTRLHPASLTKMMTLYIAFQAIEHGEISLDSMVTISRNAASQPPSRLGLKSGQRIALRYLIRAAAIKSANDAAAAIGDALGGDEAGFAARMNRTAKALGMNSTTFKNANGLTRAGHLSTARDMSTLGRRLFYDYPQYYNIFSRRTADAGMAKVANTNRRFLDAYEGADGIKTGYTVAAGFNLTASAQRGGKRIIATVFGGTSTAQRNAKMAELLDIGFGRAPNRVQEVRPEPLQYMAQAPAATAPTPADPTRVASAAPTQSPRPIARPGEPTHDREAILAALTEAVQPAPVEAPAVVATAEPAPETEPAVAAAPAPEIVVQTAAAETPRPMAAPREAFAQATEPQPETLALVAAAEPEFDESLAEGDAPPDEPLFAQSTAPQPETLAMAAAPAPRSNTVILAALTPPAPAPRAEQKVVSRASSSGGRNWGISLGKFSSQYAAERLLLKTALMESDTLGTALRKVATRKTGYEANFVGMTKGDAELACARLMARSSECTVIGP
ncbi:serine hydrolase [Sinirhodobacter sp. WL0062]|uniref:Serine hydrolase n=1 Tax=Rhodobacter flavimaris TaxID=2907145 RepID=A0ABS8YVD3_9RHOB|nr:D-alanyl-D-alanine carboxypeptidase family protein [Sinirhodobacter sp. WL0062]MCE5973663.1 serine hydrolase [Sinirhodobacter sp. WL0062]